MEHDTIPGELEHVRALKKKAKASKDQADADAKAYKEAENRLWHRMQESGMTGHKTTDANFVRKSTIYAQVQDIEQFAEWCRENDVTDEFVKEAPQKDRLNELVRQRIDDGQTLPDGVGWYSRDYISITENK